MVLAHRRCYKLWNPLLDFSVWQLLSLQVRELHVQKVLANECQQSLIKMFAMYVIVLDWQLAP